MQKDKPLKNRLENFEATPRPAVWERIEAQLDNRPKRRFVIWWWSAAALLLTALGVAIVFHPQERKNVKTQLVNQSTSQTDKGIETGETSSQVTQVDVIETDKLVRKSHQQTSNSASVTKSSTTQYTAARRAARNKSEVSFAAQMEPVFGQKAAQNESLLTESSTNPVNTNDSSDEPLTDHQDEQPKNINDELPPKRQPHGSKWTLGLAVGTYRTGITKAVNFIYSPIASDVNSGLTNFNMENAVQPNSNQDYRQIAQSFGIDLGYQLAPRWQIRNSLNALLYRTLFVNENAYHRGASYFQFAMGIDFTLLNVSKFSWSLGTGLGTGLLRNPVENTIQNHWRTEWNLNTACNLELTPRCTLRLQPTMRMIVSDTQVSGFGALSKWYYGGQIGFVFKL